jgi:hypothetical protein
MYGIRNFNDLSDTQRMACKVSAFLGLNECVRLYDKNGNHKLSVVRCMDGGFDFATPDGHVVWADCDAQEPELVEMLCNIFGTEPLEEDDP